MPILDAQHDYAHPVEQERAWSESYYFNGYCPANEFWLVTRIGIRPLQHRMDGFLVAWAPEVGMVHVELNGATDRMLDSVLDVDGLRYAMVAPAQQWRLEADAVADGKRVQLDAAFNALTPPIGADGQGRKAEGGKAIAVDTLASGHLEQAGRWTGHAVIDGRRFELIGARGMRDKSWGVRKGDGGNGGGGGLRSWHWFSINLGDDMHLGGIRIGTAAGDVHKGWVWRDGCHASIRHWDVETRFGDDNAPTELRVVARDKEDRSYLLHGTVLRQWTARRAGAVVLYECLTRFELDGGHTGFGIAEYMLRRPDGSSG